MKTMSLVLVLLVSAASGASTRTAPIPVRFESAGADRKAILAVLDAYTQAVSSKNQGRFETLLLRKSIPFPAVPVVVSSSDAVSSICNYEKFRKAVFEAAPFTQRFQNIYIEKDGALAVVSLLFVNTTPKGSTWGWKTIELLRVNGNWRIASEFFTGHSSCDRSTALGALALTTDAWEPSRSLT